MCVCAARKALREGARRQLLVLVLKREKDVRTGMKNAVFFARGVQEEGAGRIGGEQLKDDVSDERSDFHA